MAADLPIDIDYAKFLDWLVDRRRVSKSWHASLKAARVLLRSAADALPEGSTFRAPTSYYELMSTLSQLEDKSKPPPFPGSRDTDMLNRYAHPSSRAWSSARSSYESGSAYLAEAAQTLVRAADVDAPAIQADMARLRETIAECARKEGPTTRAAADARDRFQNACEEMGVSHEPGVDFERAIRGAVEKEAPALLYQAVDAGKDTSVADALAYYDDFVRYSCGSSVSAEGVEEDSVGTFRVLKGVIAGDRDMLVAKVASSTFAAIDGDAKEDGVDWGSLMESESGAGASGDGAGIDWGIEIDSSGAAEGASGGGEPAEASGEDVIVSSGAIDWGDLSGGPAIGAPAEEVVVTDPETSTALADSLTREAYRNDLLELKAFLMQRVSELSRSSDSQISLVLQQSNVVPESVRSVDKVDLEKMLSKVEYALDQIAGASARRILGLQSSNDAVERCARGLSEKMHSASRLEGSIVALANRKAVASEELRSLTPKFEALAMSSRTLIKLTEEKLTTLYKGRSVHILGEINVIFPED